MLHYKAYCVCQYNMNFTTKAENCQQKSIFLKRFLIIKSSGVDFHSAVKLYSFFIFIFRARRVSTNRMIYRQPMVTKIAAQPNFSCTKPKADA